MEKVPHELTTHIMSELDWRSITTCRLVCRLWKEIISSSTMLIYLVELGANGLADGPTNGMPTARRLEILRKHNRAWLDLFLGTGERLPSSDDDSLYELRGGVLLRASDGGTDGLQAIQLPSKLSRTKRRAWTHSNLGMELKDFSLDPEQDLLVLIQDTDIHDAPLHRQVHLRTLNTNEPHPCAERPVLHLPFEEHEGYCVTYFVIQIMGDVIGLFCAEIGESDIRESDDVSVLLIFRWTTGTLLSRLTVELHGLECSGFAFISDHSFVIPLCLYQPADGRSSSRLEVYDFEMIYPMQPHEDETFPEPVLVAVYELPLPLIHSDHGIEIEIESQPAPKTSFQPPASRRAGSIVYPSTEPTIHSPPLLQHAPKTFQRTSDSNLLVLSIFSYDSDREISPWMCIMYSDALLTYPSHVDEISQFTIPTIAWEDWGAHNCYLVPLLVENAYAPFIYGDRIATILPDGSGDHVVHILDFNPVRVRQARYSKNEAIWPASLPLPPSASVIEGTSAGGALSPFAKHVETTLPYIDLPITPKFQNLSGVMIDDECIIITYKSYEVEVFSI